MKICFEIIAPGSVLAASVRSLKQFKINNKGLQTFIQCWYSTLFLSNKTNSGKQQDAFRHSFVPRYLRFHGL